MGEQTVILMETVKDAIEEMFKKRIDTIRYEPDVDGFAVVWKE